MEITIRTIDPEVALDRAVAVDTIEFVMKASRVPCIECAQRVSKGTYGHEEISVVYYFPSPESVYLRITWYNDMWGRGEERRAERVKAALKAEFTKRFKGLEAIEPLRGPYGRPAPPPCVSEAEGTPRCTATGQPIPTEAPP